MAQKYGNWENLGRDIGGGGQNTILQVRSAEQPGKIFALKRLKNSDRRDLFEREVRAVLALNDPNILRVVDSNLASEPYITSPNTVKKGP
jgi:hypothetical protein